MIHRCHPLQLGSTQLQMPEDVRETFVVELDVRLMEGDHIAHAGHEWIVSYVRFDSASRDAVDVAVTYNGFAHHVKPYVEEPFRTEAAHA